MTKFLTLRRSVFVVALLTLAFICTASLWGGTTVHVTAQDATLQQDDLAYIESNSTFSMSSGYYSGSQVTFGLDSVSASESTVSNAMVAGEVGYENYAGCVASGMEAGAADASFISVDTSGYSLPLQSDAYLPVYISGTYAGNDVYAETAFQGTVLAHAGFSTTNPDFEMSDTSTSVGVSYDSGTVDGGGGGCCEDRRLQDQQSWNKPRLGDSYFMPASIMPFNFLFATAPKDKDKAYKLSFKKQVGIPSLTSGKVKNWKSNVPGTEDLANVSLVFDYTAIQYDAVSGTLNVKQKLRLKKAR